MWLALSYPSVNANLIAMSLAVLSDTAPIEPAGLDHCSPSQISKAFESMLYRVMPSTAYAVGRSPVVPRGTTKALVQAIFK
jgi:hypothetical protein